MKVLFLFAISTLFINGVSCQITSSTRVADIVELTDSSGNVIAKMAQIPGLKTDIFLSSWDQQEGKSGGYVTEYRFMRPAHLAANNITIILQFQEKFKNVIFDTVGKVDGVRTTIAINKMGTSLQASFVDADAIIIIKIISDWSPNTTITGIGGKIF